MNNMRLECFMLINKFYFLPDFFNYSRPECGLRPPEPLSETWALDSRLCQRDYISIGRIFFSHMHTYQGQTWLQMSTSRGYHWQRVTRISIVGWSHLRSTLQLVYLVLCEIQCKAYSVIISYCKMSETRILVVLISSSLKTLY